MTTSNLNSLLSGDGSNKKSAHSEPNAVVELSVLNLKIKKAELFRGYAGLVSVIWNLPDELKSIFESNILLNDHNEYVFLQNGFILNVDTIGAVTLDLSTLAEVSIWNQNAKTLLKLR